MQTFDMIAAWILLPFIIIGFLWLMIQWVIVPPFWLVWNFYSHSRYTRRGYCPKIGCHKKGRWAGEHVSQTYGGLIVDHLMCPDGHGSLPVGDRRAADWAGF